MPIGSGIVYNTGDLILSQVSSSGTAFLETKIAAATSSLIYFDSTARINSASLNSITVGTASYVSGSTSIITNLTASNISASGTGSFGIVGIGTVNPAYKLDVNGNANFTNGFYTNTDASSTSYFVGANGTRPIIFQNNTATSYDFGFKFSDSNTFTIVGGNTLANPTTDLVSFTYDGKVGIGTTVPSALLHIYTGSIGSTAYPLLIDNSSGGAGVNVVGFGFANGGIMKHSITTAIYGNDYMAFNVGQGASYNQERMRIDSTGNVGVGTTTVSRKLHAYITTGPVMRLQSSGSNASIEFIPSIGHNRYNWLIGAQQNISDAFEITPSTATNGTTFSNPAILVKSDGNVGIGTTSPVSALTVQGDIIVNYNSSTTNFVRRTFATSHSASNRGATLWFSISDGSETGIQIVNTGSSNPSYNSQYIAFHTHEGAVSAAERMRIDPLGNIGIGTTSPLEAITFGASNSIIARSSATTFNSGYCSRILFNQGGTGYGYLGFYTYEGGSGGGERMRISENGTVGIGTTNPIAKLQVAGNISGSSFTSSVSNAVGFLGTASWAQNVVSSSYATTAQTANALNASNTYTVAGLTSAYVDVNGSSAPTTGIYRPSTKTLGLSADSTLIFKISNVSTPATSSIETGNFLVSGSVGIGTTSPSAKLTIVDNTNGGTINLVGRTSDDTAAINFRATGDASTYAYVSPDTNEFRLYHNDGFMSFYPGGTEKVRITSGGNVGIGTTVPSGSLTVQSNANQLRLQTSSGPGAYFTEISSRYDSTHPFQLGVANNSSTATEFFGIYADSGGSNNRSVFPTGNVGIGTTSPNSKLEVAGGSGTAIISINNTTAGRSGSFGIDSNGVYIQNSNNGDYFDLKNASGTARFRMIYDNATHLTTNFVSIGNLSATGSKLSVFGNLSVGSTYGSTAAPSNGAIFQGSVGIGTTSPDSSLHVYSTSFEPTIRLTSTSGSVKTYGLVNNPYWATGSFHIYDFTTDNSRIHISSGGNIGIAVGAATPANRLDVVGDLRVRAAGAAMILDTATTSDGRMEYKYNGTRKALIGVDSDNLQISADSGNFLQFRTNGSERIRITNGGSVGIGTSNPYYLFDLYDTGPSDAMMSLRSSGSGNARIYLDAANGDLTGGDYCYLGQDNSSLDFIINTGGSAGNIHLQPKEGTNNGILYVSGSTRFGRVISQTHEFTGSINLSGSLNATASWANNVVSASYATTANALSSMNISQFTNNSKYHYHRTDISSLSSSATNLVQPISTFDYNNATNGPGAAWYNYFSSTHGDYLTSLIANQHRTANWYVAYKEGPGGTPTNPVWYALLHEGNYTTYTVTKTGTGASGTWSITSSIANALNTVNNYTVGSLTSTTQLGGSSGTLVSYVTPGVYATGTSTGNAIGIISNTTFANNGAIANIGLNQSSSNANDITAKVHMTIGGWYQNSGTGIPIYLGNGYTIESSPTMVIAPADANGGGNVGIGTTNPIAKLHVVGNISGSSFTSSISNAVGFLGTSSWAQTANALNTGNTYTVAGLTSAYVDVTGAGTIPTTGIYRPSTKTLGLSADGTLVFKISNVSAPATSSIETGNFLVQSGNVGIGTTNATDKLTVYGAMASYKTGADTVQTQVYLANGGNTRAFNLQLNSGGTGLDLWSYNSANAWLKHTTFDYDGRVGIGTAAPAAKLEISGSSNSALLHVKSPISGAILYVSGSGAVGINTSTVGAYTLQVNGSFAATTKSFVIDHPTKAGKRLIYGSLESPYHGIRLTGRDTLKDGKCKIQLPDYIYKLILHDSVNIQLTGIKCNKTLYVDDINIPENYFTIAYDKALFESYKDYDFFWDFTAIRADVPELNTEL